MLMCCAAAPSVRPLKKKANKATNKTWPLHLYLERNCFPHIAASSTGSLDAGPWSWAKPPKKTGY
jgi:hypothetical protein